MTFSLSLLFLINMNIIVLVIIIIILKEDRMENISPGPELLVVNVFQLIPVIDDVRSSGPLQMFHEIVSNRAVIIYYPLIIHDGSTGDTVDGRVSITYTKLRTKNLSGLLTRTPTGTSHRRVCMCVRVRGRAGACVYVGGGVGGV